MTASPKPLLRPEAAACVTAEGLLGSFTGTVGACDEGVLEWVEKDKAHALPTWEGDRIFLKLMEEGGPFFSLKLRYEGETLREAVLNGTERLV